MDASISAATLGQSIRSGEPPLVIDVRRNERFKESPYLVKGALPAPAVRKTAEEKAAVPYDVPDVEFSHEGELCSFDAFVRFFRLKDPALDELALIVRGADTNRLDLAPQAPGLAAISLGLSRNFANDHEMLEHGMVMYDALYAWCKEGKNEIHTWNPTAYK